MRSINLLLLLPLPELAIHMADTITQTLTMYMLPELNQRQRRLLIFAQLGIISAKLLRSAVCIWSARVLLCTRLAFSTQTYYRMSGKIFVVNVPLELRSYDTIKKCILLLLLVCLCLFQTGSLICHLGMSC